LKVAAAIKSAEKLAKFDDKECREGEKKGTKRDEIDQRTLT